MFVNLVGDGVAVPFLTKSGYSFEFAAGKHLSGRIVGRIDDNGFGFFVESSGQFILIEMPVGCVQFDILWDCSRQNTVGAVVFVKRFENNDLVAGIDDGFEGSYHGFGGTTGDRDIGIGITFYMVIALKLFG